MSAPGTWARVPLALPVVVGACFAAASTALPLGDPDAYWHLATARETLADGLVRADRFSWTVAGEPVPTDQWLGQLAWYSAYTAGGWSGVLALRTLSVALLVGLLAFAALRERPSGPLVALIAAAPAIVLSRVFWVERPELLGAVCLAALVPLLRAGRQGSDAALVFVAPLLVLWANLHGSFALGVALALLVAGEGIVRDRGRIRPYLVAAAGALLALVATPSGLATAASPGLHFTRPPREIMEWAVPDPSTPAGFLGVASLGAVLAVAALSGRARVHEALVIVPVAFLSLTAIRQVPLLAVVAAPYLAARLPEAWRAFWALVRPGAPVPALRGGAPPRVADAFALAGGALLVGAAVLAAPGVPDEARYPRGALVALQPAPGLFNHYDWGGWLIWNAPDTPVFVDGRLVPYLDAVLPDYRAVIELRPEWREVLERRNVRALLVRPGDPVAVRARELGWPVLVGGDDFVLIEVRRP